MKPEEEWTFRITSCNNRVATELRYKHRQERPEGSHCMKHRRSRLPKNAKHHKSTIIFGEARCAETATKMKQVFSCKKATIYLCFSSNTERRFCSRGGEGRESSKRLAVWPIGTTNIMQSRVYKTAITISIQQQRMNITTQQNQAIFNSVLL